MIDEKRFEEARNKIVGKTRERNGVGTLQEKTIHAILKHYYAPNEEMHEIPIGSYVADIYNGEEIIEIQNGNFYKIRTKLEALLAEFPVTVVYPIPHTKWLIWIDEQTGEFSAKRKSPVTGTIYRAFSELYRIKEYLNNENLRFRFPLIDLEEYRLLNGWSRDKKKGSSRFDRLPVALWGEVSIERKEDYLQLLPYGLPEEFTSGDLSEMARIPVKTAGLVLNIMTFLRLTKQIGKKGHFNLYQIEEELL